MTRINLTESGELRKNQKVNNYGSAKGQPILGGPQ